MATEWIGGVPEEEQQKYEQLDLQRIYKYQSSIVGNLDEPSPFQQFCKNMWERKVQLSAPSENIVDKNVTDKSNSKHAIFKM